MAVEGSEDASSSSTAIENPIVSCNDINTYVPLDAILAVTTKAYTRTAATTTVMKA